MTYWMQSLSAVQTTAQILLIHGGESTAPKLAAALPGANVAIAYRKGLSSAYSEVSGLAKDYPKLPTLLEDFAPQWKPGVPLIVLAFSAGGWALRYYLRDPEARALITSAIFLDSLYGSSGSCDLAPYQGVIAYGKEANANPSAKRLIMTYSQGSPTPAICSKAIADVVGPGQGVIVKGYNNADHSAQQGVVGPEMVKEYIAPWLGRSSSVSSGASTSSPWLLAGAAVLVVGAVYWVTRGGYSAEKRPA